MMDITFISTFVLTSVTVVLVAILSKIYLSFGYFSKRNIPFDKPRSPLGSLGLSSSMTLFLWDLYKRSGENKLYGFFVIWRPSILINDLELIKDVLVKNFSAFHDRGVYFNEKDDPLTAHLFAIEGEAWKKIRNKLSPAFTSGKLKQMFPTLLKFGNKLVNFVAEKPESEPLECFHLTAKYTLSNIASTAFGIESDLFDEGSKFMEMALKFNVPSFEQLIRSFFSFHLQSLAHILHFKIIPRDISSFFLKMTKDAVSFREKNEVQGNDFLQMLIQLKNRGYIDDSSDDNVCLTMDQISAQAFVFIIGGFETSALTQSWALYELAANPTIQHRLQAEIDTMDQWTYENIHELKYLEMVLNETLRKYPIVPFIIRRCNEDYKVPNSDVVIEKGSDVNISVYGLHRDPKLFPNPDTFDPERFGPNPPHEIKPFSYLPFGDGPRFCIGMRFAKLQSKIGIAMMVKNYTVELSEKATEPLELHPQTIQPTAKNGFWLRFKKRNMN